MNGQSYFAADSLQAAPGVAVGILLIVAAVAWFSPVARRKFRKATLWLSVLAIAVLVLYGYLGGAASA
ncbi:hypothetical protein [Haloglycomyces albus]|uniref:hypothetical protein n=1 Tax=Haloglycomyces albus TaxID=526067 RepID=UPI00046CF856|nr:hypothetical protein [Haloglycomyces albus]